MSLVEFIRAVGFAAAGIHLVLAFAIPLLVTAYVCHLVAFLFRGVFQRALRFLALLVSAPLFVVFALSLYYNAGGSVRNVLIAFLAAWMLFRSGMLLRQERAKLRSAAARATASASEDADE